MNTKVFLTAAAITCISLLGCSPSSWAVRGLQDGTGVKQGEQVRILQRDGTDVEGIYEGLAMIPPAEYLEEYSSGTSLTPRVRELPEIGQKVKLFTSLSDDKDWEGRLIGFDHKSIWIALEGKEDPVEFYFSSLTRLSGRDSGSFGRMMLRELYLDGEIPLMSALVVKNGSGTVRVPVSSIRELLTEGASGGKLTMSVPGDRLRSLAIE